MGRSRRNPLTKPQDPPKEKPKPKTDTEKPRKTQNPELAALLSPPGLTGSSGRARLGGLGHSGWV